MKKVSIQGIRGAFHEEAANLYFKKDVEIIPNLTFSDLVCSVQDETADYGVIAIENTISGTINQNLEIIRQHNVQIIGEQKLRIVQNLGVLPGTKMKDLTEVRSHYMAINQCRKYFSNHPNIKLIDEEDTALSAKNIADKHLEKVGAIGSLDAMKFYGLEVLEKSIESNKLNFTRFFVIKKRDSNPPSIGDKLTVQLTLDHKVGSLARLLSKFQLCNASLTKIESAPIIGNPWNYQFYIEAEIAENSYDQIIETLNSETIEFKILGRYQPHKSHSHESI